MKKQNYRTIVADLSTQMESLVKILGDENLVRWLNSQYDPTGIKADYTQWLAKQFKKIGGLPTNTKELLKEFDRLKKIGELKGKFSPDIGSYKTIEDIRKAIAPYQGFTSKKQQKKKQVEGMMMTLSNYGEITYGSSGYLLLYVDDAEKVSSFLNVLGITSWCLRHEDMAANYTPITFLIKNGKVVANLAGSEGVIYDRNDEHSENPEHYEVLMESGSDVLFESRTLYENFPDKTKMKVREYCAKDAKRAQVFAVYVLHNMFPEGEEVISKNAQSSYLYAYNALGGRFPAGEAAILADGDYVGDYAVNIMRGRWPAGEKKILERPHDAFKYARHCIKGEWIEGEPIIATDASSAVAYAIHILKGSFPKAEETIAKDSYYSYAYARDCLKHRFPQGEASMLGDTRNGYADAVSYAGDIIEARWPELEEKLSEDVIDAQQETFESRRYCRIFNLYYNEELKKFISLIHIEPDIKELREPVSSRPPEGTELEGEVGRPVDASFRPLESLIMTADLESQMPALLKIMNDAEHIRTINSLYDPTGKKADYTQWLVKLWKREDGLPGNVFMMLKEFDRLKKLPALKGKFNPDINSYKTTSDLRAALSQFTGAKSKKEQRRSRVNGVMMNLSEYGEKITQTESDDGDDYILLECASSSKVVKFLDTLDIDSWCIRQEKHAEHYVPIVFLIRNGSVVANLAEDGCIYDRQDESSDDVEHYEVLLRNGYNPTEIDDSIWGKLPEDLKEVVEKDALTSPQKAYHFATSILGNAFPEGEPVIATSAAYALAYARWVLHDRFVLGEKLILDEAEGSNYLRDYITYVVKSRWPEAEPTILKSSDLSNQYAQYVIKGRWQEGESVIARVDSSSLYYARNCIKERFPEGEPAIAGNGWYSTMYAKDVLHGRFELGEPAIAKDGSWSYDYAMTAIKARFPMGEAEIAKDYYYKTKYGDKFGLDWDESVGKFVPRKPRPPEELEEIKNVWNGDAWAYDRYKKQTQAQDKEIEERFSSYRKLADLESQMPALLKIISNEETIRWLNEQYDPSGTKADYTQWLVKLFAGGAFHGYTPNVYNHLKEFDRLKKLPALKGKLNLDIGSYKTYPALIQAIKPFEGMVSKKKQKTTNVHGVMMNLNDYGEVKHVGDYTLLHVTDPWKVSDFLIKLRITAWCIKDVGYAKDYYPITFILRDGKVLANLASNGRIYDRADDTDEDPGHYSVLLHGGFDVRYINLSTFNQLEPEDAKLMKSKAAELPISAYAFATNVMDGPFPEGEDVIATDSGYSYSYASMVLHDRFPKGEPMIATSSHHAIVYAIHIIKGRFPEGEPAILTRADSILRYARQVIGGRWLEGEEALLKLGQQDELCDYAENVMRERWPAAEEIFLRVGNPWVLYWYVKNVVKSRWPEAEPLIGNRYDASSEYADNFGLVVTTTGDGHYEFKEIGESK